MTLTMTEKLEAKVTVRVVKTGKTYTRSKHYGKIVTEFVPSKEGGWDKLEVRSKRYFLPSGRKWIEVSEEEFKKETTKAKVQKLHEKLGEELRQRVEREMEGE